MVVSVAVVAATVVVVSGGLAGNVWRGNDLGACGAVRVARGGSTGYYHDGRKVAISPFLK